MRRPSHVAVILLASLLFVAAKADESCPHGSVPPSEAREELYHQISMRTEAVSGGRRRAVEPPSNTGTPPLVIANFIDTHVAAKQKADGVKATVIAGDEEFLRRVTLDLTGQIPDPAAVQAFVADTTADKRARKIDELLASDAFVDRWTMWFGDLVQNVQFANNVVEYYLGRNAYHLWIKESIRSNKPYDVMVRELLAGKGENFTTGVANYVVRQMQNNGPIQDTYDNLAAHSTEKFLGMPTLCVSCHSGQGHLELVNWYLRGKTREDFWKMSAFFAKTASRGARYTDPANPNAMLFQFTVGDNAAGSYRLNTRDGNKSPRQPAEGQSIVVNPAFLLTGEQPRAGEDLRGAYGRMLTADRQFARATVNYLWKEMFGLGLVEPLNSFDLAKLDTQPLNPALLEALADELIAKNYDLRAVLRTMAMSSTYQLSSRYTPGAWNEAWVPYFARRYPKRMMAEMMLDAVVTATTVPISMSLAGLGTLTKAMQLPDPTEGGRGVQGVGTFLDQFGRGDRDDVGRTNDSSITQSLAMMNSTLVVQRVRRSGPTAVRKALDASSDPGTITDRLYLATLSRKPTAEERQVAIDYLRGGTLGDRAEDLQFALLNSLEFLFY